MYNFYICIHHIIFWTCILKKCFIDITLGLKPSTYNEAIMRELQALSSTFANVFVTLCRSVAVELCYLYIYYILYKSMMNHCCGKSMNQNKRNVIIVMVVPHVVTYNRNDGNIKLHTRDVIFSLCLLKNICTYVLFQSFEYSKIVTTAMYFLSFSMIHLYEEVDGTVLEPFKMPSARQLI